MFSAVITGDVIASTSLSISDREIIELGFRNLFDDLQIKFNIFGRNIQGDYIECVIPDPEYALRVALIIKAWMKALPINKPKNFIPTKNTRKFHTYGIRLAIGLGELSRFDREQGIIDGEAIYQAGRKINKYSSYDKERIVIKETLFLASTQLEKYEMYDPLLSLIDEIVNKSTSKQCQVLFWKLLGKNEEEISTILSISQPVVNKHSQGIGWNAIDKAVNYFEKTLKG